MSAIPPPPPLRWNAFLHPIDPGDPIEIVAEVIDASFELGVWFLKRDDASVTAVPIANHSFVELQRKMS